MSDPFAEYILNPDRRHLSRFIVAYTEPVARLVRRLIPCPEASRDVVQDVFLRLAESDLRLDDVPHPRAYVFRAALNTARNYLRKEKARLHHEHEAGKLKPAESPSVEEEVTSREAVERLYASIDSLPEPLRVAVHLRAVEGFSLREIALVTGLPIGTVGSRIRKAREELRRLLGGRQLDVAWANLELAREHGWFPAATDGLSRAALSRLRKVAKPARTMIAPAAIVAFVTLAALGVSVPWVMEGPPVVSRRDEVATSTGERRGVQVGSATPSVATSERPEKPMAPVVVGAETGISEAEGDEPDAGSPDSAARESEGGETMIRSERLVASAVLAVGMAAAVDGGETGDFDGDGLVTIRDVMLVKSSARDSDVVFAQDSLPPFSRYPCYTEPKEGFSSHGDLIPSSVYLESLSRSFDSSLPAYSFMHWPTDWLQHDTQPTLPGDVRVRVTLLPIVVDRGDTIDVNMEVATDVPIRAFSIALESDEGLVRVPWKWPSQPENLSDGWNVTDWLRIWQWNNTRHDRGDLLVNVPPAAYLVTGGRYVINYGLLGAGGGQAGFAAGSYLVTTEGRLPRGTRPGTYLLKVSPASQILLEDGTLVSPGTLESTEITVTNEVQHGWDEGLPPLEIDSETRSVLGSTEFRFVDVDGTPVEAGSPVAVGEPGEEVVFRVQVRMEAPLNYMHFSVHWPRRTLGCTGKSRSLFEDVAGGEPYQVGREFNRFCESYMTEAKVNMWYWIGGNWSPEERPDRLDKTTHPRRALEYFRPLNEWVDLYEVRLQVDPAFRDEVIPLRFGQKPEVEFAPYSRAYPCKSDEFPTDRGLWEYDVKYPPTSFIKVEGDPAGPSDFGIQFVLGDVQAQPGEVVEVPFYASSEVPIGHFVLALELDPHVVSVDSVDTRVIKQDGSGDIARTVTGRGETVGFQECPEDGGKCTTGIPLWTLFRPSEDRFVVVDWLGGVGEEPVEVARLRVSVLPDAAEQQTFLTPAKVSVEVDGFEVPHESGGYIAPFDFATPFSPASVVGGRIEIVDADDPNPVRFRRGECNGDDQVNLTDAVCTLNWLFGGDAMPGCTSALNVNGDEGVNLADPVSLLSFLFSGGSAPVAPFPDCALGMLAADSELGCANPPDCQ